MVVAFLAVMIVTNSVASAFGHPVVALLVGPLLALAVLWLYSVAVRHLEKRPATELSRYRAIRQVGGGTLGGVGLAAFTIGVIALAGGYRVLGWGSISGALTVLGMMCAVAVAEEVLFRGVVFRLLERSRGTWVALVVSSALFGVVHLVNPGATFWGALAIAIEAGLMLGAAFVATGSLWLAIGLHFGWNIATVAVFGTVGSGRDAQGVLLQAVTDGPTWLTGGGFGPEGSVIAIVACSVTTVLLLRYARRHDRIVARPVRTSASSHAAGTPRTSRSG